MEERTKESREALGEEHLICPRVAIFYVETYFIIEHPRKVLHHHVSFRWSFNAGH